MNNIIKKICLIMGSIGISANFAFSMDYSSPSVTLSHILAVLKQVKGERDINDTINKAINFALERGPTQEEIGFLKKYISVVDYVDYEYDDQDKKFHLSSNEDDQDEVGSAPETLKLEDVVNNFNTAILKVPSLKNQINPSNPEDVKEIKLKFDYTGDKTDSLYIPKMNKIKVMLANKFSQIISTEEGDPQKLALYHAVAPWNEFLIEIVTRVLTNCHNSKEHDACRSKVFRYSPLLDQVNNIEEFRQLIFTNLGPLDPDPKICNEDCQRKREQVAEVLKIKGMTDDSNPIYKETAISMSPSIFAGHSTPNESAIGFWINSFASSSATLDIYKSELKRFFGKFLKQHEILFESKTLIDDAVLFYETLFPVPTAPSNDGTEARIGGVLYQFFVSPEIINDMLYVSTPFGFKAKKQIGSNITSQTDIIFEQLKTNISTFIQENKGFSYTNPKEIKNVLCKEGVDLLCTQVRMLPKWKWLDSPQVKINSYFLDEPSPQWLMNFNKVTNHLANKVLAVLEKKRDSVKNNPLNGFQLPSSDGERIWWERVASTIQPLLSNPYINADQLGEKVTQEASNYLNASQVKQLVDSARSSNTITEREIKRHHYTVNRPNHGFAHGLRQGFLASDIIDLFTHTKPTSFSTPVGKKMAAWVTKKVQEDHLFKKKVELLASFQRVGRLSDTEDAEGKVRLYYSNRDEEIFVSTVRALDKDKNPFGSVEEIKIFAKALIIYPHSLTNSSDFNEDQKNLARIVMASHYLDLRRQISFDKTKVLSNIVNYLFDKLSFVNNENTEQQQNFEDQMTDILWQRTADYLEASGESWIDDPSDRQSYADRFYLLSNDSRALTQAFLTVKQNKFTLK